MEKQNTEAKGNTMTIKEVVKKYKYYIGAGAVVLALGTGVAIYSFAPGNTVETSVSTAQKTTKETDYEKAEKAVKKAETEQTKENVESAKALVKKVKDTDKSKALSDRLDKVSKNILAKEQATAQETKAEKAVKSAEDNQTRENVAVAQTEVNKVTNADKKASLQARLDAVSNALTVKEQATAQAEAERVAAEQAAAQAEADRVAAEQAAQAQANQAASADSGYTQSYNTGGNTGGSSQTYSNTTGGGSAQSAQQSGSSNPGYSPDQDPHSQDQLNAWNQQANNADWGAVMNGSK